MSEQDVIRMIPVEINKVLNYIESYLFNKHETNKVLNFYHVMIDNQDVCVLEITKDDGYEQIEIGILSCYDYLFYRQLFVSILDKYLKNSQVFLSLIYPRNDSNDNLSYSFYLLSKDKGNVNIQINSTHDLSDFVNYYNETIWVHEKENESEIGGAKR